MTQEAEDAFDADENEAEYRCDRERYPEAAENVDMLMADKAGRMFVITTVMPLAAVDLATGRVAGMVRPMGLGRWHHALNFGARRNQNRVPSPLDDLADWRGWPLLKPQAARRVSCRIIPEVCALAAS